MHSVLSSVRELWLHSLSFFCPWTHLGLLTLLDSFIKALSKHFPANTSPTGHTYLLYTPNCSFSQVVSPSKFAF